jgi:hypothetical protein
MKVNGSEFIKIAEETKQYDHIIGGMSMMQSLVTIHPLQLPAGWKFSRPNITCITWKQHLNNKAKYTNTQQGLPVQKKDFTSNHARLLASAFVCQKATK